MLTMERWNGTEWEVLATVPLKSNKIELDTPVGDEVRPGYRIVLTRR